MTVKSDHEELWNIHSEIVSLLQEEIKILKIKLAISEEEKKQLKILLKAHGAGHL